MDGKTRAFFFLQRNRVIFLAFQLITRLHYSTMNFPQLNNFTDSPDQIVVFEQKGRVINGTDFSSFTLKIVKDFNSYVLKVSHGGGTEKFHLFFDRYEPVIQALKTMDADTSFLTVFAFYDLCKSNFEKGFNVAESTYQRAAAEGRLKTRKVRGENRVKVWVEESPVEMEKGKVSS